MQIEFGGRQLYNCGTDYNPSNPATDPACTPVPNMQASGSTIDRGSQALGGSGHESPDLSTNAVPYSMQDRVQCMHVSLQLHAYTACLYGPSLELSFIS